MLGTKGVKTMEDKEERIRALLAKNPCKECPVKKCTRKCMFGLLFEKEPGMTRQEAIEKILKAICGKNRLERCYKCSYKDTEKCIKFCKDNYIEQAEAALNALLEGGKEIKDETDKVDAGK